MRKAGARQGCSEASGAAEAQTKTARSPGTLQSHVPPGALDEDPAHGVGRCGKEMGAVLPRRLAIRPEPSFRPKDSRVGPNRGHTRKLCAERTIYLHLPKYDTIVLFYLYTKARRENLSPEQLRRLRDAAAIIKQEFRA